jgi:hypothetical protein
VGLPLVRFCVVLFITAAAVAQTNRGELRLSVTDPSGQGVAASGALVGQAAQARYEFATDASGRRTITRLPFGRYHLTITAPGFLPYSSLVEIRSETPEPARIRLSIAPIATTIEVTDSDTLLDPYQVGAVQHAGADALARRPASAPGRDIVEIVNRQTGWLLEANGVLHPRGSEYGVQYVLDGEPIIDNRSPAFAPVISAGELESVTVRTGGYPAEYGRQLGGVIELSTARDLRPGWHGKLALDSGGFDSRDASAFFQYTVGKNTFHGEASGFDTDRYLDPAVAENYTNRASGGDASAGWERLWNDHHRTRAAVRYGRVGFEVPNERLQQAAGQRQDRATSETGGELSHTWLLNAETIASGRVAARDLSALLWSNALSTPIQPFQDRGFRETYVAGSISAHRGRHELKAGADAIFRSIRERFFYRITAFEIGGTPVFDDSTPARFSFADHSPDREQAAYVQDLVRLGAVMLSAGIRWDHYRLMENGVAWSPRLAAAWQTPISGLIVRASYDRVFQTPAIENILLASAGALRALNPDAVVLPLRPSRANYYEAGFSKSFWGKFRLDGSFFRRTFRDFADDSLLLNTGVTFPVAFSSADIQGVEARLELPRWGRVSGLLAYSNLVGRGRLPLAGGVFLEEGAAELLSSNEEFAITQDQRNTARAQVRVELPKRAWIGAGALYGSGLPVEIEGIADQQLLESQYGPAILSRVNFERGRVRPSFALNLAGGVTLIHRDRVHSRVQVDVMNVTDRLNIINFAGLFSGTALDAPRWASLRWQIDF